MRYHGAMCPRIGLAAVVWLCVSTPARADMAPTPEQPAEWIEHPPPRPPPPPDPELAQVALVVGLLLAATAVAWRSRDQLAEAG